MDKKPKHSDDGNKNKRKAGMSEDSLWNMHFLAWLDALEKLDILVLEIRHLQHTCIYSLREPALLDVLRTEEVLVDPFAGDRANLAACFEELVPDDCQDTLRVARRVARRWVPLFPPLFGDARTQKRSDLEVRLDGICVEGLWSDSSRDLYQVLRAAQQVKRQIFADRLTLFLEGFQALNLEGRPADKLPEPAALAELFILRMAVLSRSHNHMRRVGDLQQRLAQHLESSPAQYPRPSVHRRRMQGAYTQYLADRTTYLRQSMNMLLNRLQGGAERTAPCSTIFHRWEHSQTSRQDVFLDEMEERGLNGDLDEDVRNSESRVEFVQTGYWMLDKPDNQPILAHEVAHHALRQHYKNLHPYWLCTACEDDEFAQLMVRIFKVIDSYRAPSDLDFPPWVAERGLINPLEIACDLLALSVKGISYLYAFFLEAVGWGLEHSMVDEQGYLPHLSVRLEMRKVFDAPRVRDLKDWYVRGRVLLEWANSTRIIKTKLDEQLRKGCSDFLNALEERLDDAILFRQFKSGVYWRRLADRICQVVADSKAAESVSDWRNDRRQDGYYTASVRRFPRGSQRLPLQLRGFLARILCGSKFSLYEDESSFRRDVGKAGSAPAPDLLQSLDWRYALGDNWSDLSVDDAEDNARTLFKHTFDIPWQCAWLRASDFLNLERKLIGPDVAAVAKMPPRRRAAAILYNEINWNASLGRGLFFVAIELDGLASQSPCHRLRTVVRELRRSVSLGRIDLGTMPDVNEWLREAVAKLVEESGYIEQGRFTDARRVQWEQGQHTDAFLNVVNKRATNQGGTPNAVWTELFGSGRSEDLKYYVSTRSKGARAGLSSYYERLTGYFNTVDAASRPASRLLGAELKMSLASRASVAGELSMGRAEATNPLIRLYSGEVTVEGGKGEAVATCGYYNALFIKHEIKQLCRCTLPRIRVDDQPVAMPMFMRRETWINLKRLDRPVASEPVDDDEGGTLDKCMAVYYIQLHRRFARLDFIDWIYAGGGRDRLGLGRRDRLFLTDGWSDVVLLLGDETDDGVGRSKEDFFSVRDRIAEHFLVRRIEAIATMRWFELSGDGTYASYVSVRIDDSSPTRRSFEDFCRSCDGMRPEAPATVNAIPGATDLTLSFDAGIDRYGWLRRLGTDNLRDVDRLLIQVGKRYMPRP